MSRQELEIKAKEFNSKLKRHPMSSEELQKVLCDFAEALQIQDVSVQSEHFVCNHPMRSREYYTSGTFKCYQCGKIP